ncbi:MFS transporter [Legionella spiritensis]|uniref:Lysosomal dipeptide transporter MFSD1 n=1 Tax=Legionella spiritensis TaxID=452 RepID=A0A0W0Z492_LEGSP|nr:MFS transporter [Legionella spiritensis]KTD63917.1 major facilitator family transporter [Legionella spiritensis]SNV36515.1 major facilitator family transporter [Legionella spiritensis]
MKSPRNRYLVILPYLSLGISIAFYINQYFLRMSITGISDFITKTFDINAITLSLVSATFYYTYALMQIPAGLIIDRYSPRLILSTASLAVTLGAVICWHADRSGDLFFARAFMGLGGAFGFLSILKIASVYFKKETFALINGLTIAIGTFASILAGAPLLLLLQTVSWKSLVFNLSIASFIIAIIALLFLRPFPQTVATKKQSSKPDQKKKAGYSVIFKNLNIWKAAFFCGFTFNFITVFAGLWLIPVLKTTHPELSGIYTYGNSIMLTGYGLGALGLGYLIQLIKKITVLMRVSSIAILILFSLFLVLPTLNIYMQFIIVFFLGIAVSSTTLSFSYVAKTVSSEISGMAFSLINLSQILIGALVLPLSGYLVYLTSYYHNLPNASTDLIDYQLAMSVLIISALVSIFCSWRLKEPE